MKIAGIVFLLCFLGSGCDGEAKRERELERLLETDREFSRLSVDQGAYTAFDSFMFDDAIIYRDRSHPIRGRDAIRGLFTEGKSGTLRWEPFFADIAESGDLGYTLGEYAFTTADSHGVDQTSTGYYVTIWKRLGDGSWKYTFDTGVRSPSPLTELN
jgi:ketosteroid isomerase-like protein